MAVQSLSVTSYRTSDVLSKPDLIHVSVLALCGERGGVESDSISRLSTQEMQPALSEEKEDAIRIASRIPLEDMSCSRDVNAFRCERGECEVKYEKSLST